MKTMLAVAAAYAVAFATPAFTQTGAASSSTPPGASVIAPSSGGASPPASIGATRTTEAPYESPAGGGAAPATLSPTTAHRDQRIHRSRHAASEVRAVEPAQGHLKLIRDSFAYNRPGDSSTKVQPVQAGHFVNVTGTTSSYAQVRLKSGQIAYVPLAAIDLVKPADKRFKLTADATVLSAPNHSAKKVAEVHSGRDVHVIGIAMNYAKIKMKDGQEGFISIHALE
jgi:hypothetical protein